MQESGVTKHNYLFCQFVNPARGHEGDRCDCFDTPSQRRTTLAKQRLARLRANRQINRASTSNDPESAVASDPAVTPNLARDEPMDSAIRQRLFHLSTEQDHHTSEMHPPLPNHDKRKRSPLPTSSYGPNNRPNDTQWPRSH